MFIRRIAIVLLLNLCTVAACVATDDDAPSSEELDGLDDWATTADGKADLPTSWTDLVAWLKDFYMNRMSAIWDNQEHPATAARAMDRIKGLVAQVGGLDATKLRYRATVRRLHAGPIDHSEVDILLPGATVIRLVGDPKGAGAFVDWAQMADPVGPPLCLTWDELQTAVTASYRGGAYGLSYVCHTVTEHVLRSLHVGSSLYSKQIRTYQAARYIWGPLLPSGNSSDPASWAVSRSCN